DDKDPDCSRIGAGGNFHKQVFNLFRLQPMPKNSSLLLKNSFQYSNYNLAASEQFQLGGATSVRGYPPAEYAGDKGFYSAVEWSFPPYGLSKDVNVPFRKEKLYDSLRFVAFWDIGLVNLNNAQPGEDKTRTLKGAGCGVRLNLEKNLDFRVEVGWPIGGPTPSDGDHAHTWVEFNWKF
ncbi:MAG: BamA/TamA family outer membrane protein, partial [Methanosarcinaceae archaeon]|nr:BamA/TamA family outer membrane protein [Methanosarcinaceae archaeon]